MEYTRLDDKRLDEKREHQRGVVFEEIYEGVYNKKAILDTKRWDVCMNRGKALTKGGYSTEVSNSNCKKVISKVVGYQIYEGPMNMMR